MGRHDGWHFLPNPPESPVVLALEEGAGKEVGAVSKPQGRRVHVRKVKVKARKVSEVCTPSLA